MLHLAIAEDVAVLAGIDGLPDDTRMVDAQADLPEYGSMISQVAFGEEWLLRSLWEPLDDDNDESDPFPNETIDDLIERGGKAGSAIALGLIPPGSAAVLGSIVNHLRHALAVVPADVRDILAKTAGRIARLAIRLLHRAREAIAVVLGNYRPTVEGVLGAIDPRAWISDHIFSNALEGLSRLRTSATRPTTSSTASPSKSGSGHGSADFRSHTASGLARSVY